MKREIYKSVTRYLWIILLIISYIFFTYYFNIPFFQQRWKAAVGTVLILFFSYLLWGKDFLKIVGLKLDFKKIIKSLILIAIIIIGSLWLMKYIAHHQYIKITFPKLLDVRHIHVIFYTLNEEIVLGALTLFVFVNKWKIKPICASIALALAFSLIHYVFFRWVFQTGIIHVTTLVSLFLIGFVRNNLILLKGHIGYSWALHFGWMVIMVDSAHIKMYLPLNEPSQFNTYVGSTEMLIIAIVIASLSLLYWIKKEKTAKVSDEPGMTEVQNGSL